MISGISTVVLPVDDQKAALEFWTEKVGFTTVRDDSYGDERWIEVKPPEHDLLVVVLSLRPPGQARPTGPAGQPDSHLFFDCRDIQQTHAELAARGVTFTQPPIRMHFGWWAMFADNEGTQHALGQWSEQAAWRAEHPNP